MKISCEVIKDLLPLYHDGVCSNESKTMIEKHLAECDKCKAELQLMEQSLHITYREQNVSEAEAIKKLSKKWRKGMLKSFLKGTIITILNLAVVLLIFYLFVGIRIVYI